MFNTGAEAVPSGVFGLSDKDPILQNPMCNGNEYYLSDCQGYTLNNIAGDYCLSGNYQAGARCIEGFQSNKIIFNHFFVQHNNIVWISLISFFLVTTTPTSSCYDGTLRLENSTFEFTSVGYVYGGRLEVCYNGIYHPVCDEGWTENDSTVACSNAGYPGYSKKRTIVFLLTIRQLY